MRRTLIISAALLLTACGDNDTAPGPGGVTIAESRALDEAAEMIEARRLPEGALEPAAPGTLAAPQPPAPPPASGAEPVPPAPPPASE